MQMMSAALVGGLLLIAPGAQPPGFFGRDAGMSAWVPVAAAVSPARETPVSATKQPSPEEIMNSRYPQPIKVGDLIGLPVLDYSDSTIGYVRNVVRTPAGKIQLIVTEGGWPAGWSTWRSRLVAVPIETVAILGRQLAALEMTREQFAAAPTWSETEGQAVAANDMIRIAITRR
jgi:hypothetical protein